MDIEILGPSHKQRETLWKNTFKIIIDLRVLFFVLPALRTTVKPNLEIMMINQAELSVTDRWVLFFCF